MSKEKKQKDIYTSVFKTKLWKKLSLCWMGAATGSVLLLALLFFGSRSIIYRHKENRDVQQTQKDQVMAELNRQAKLKDWKHTNVKYIPLAQTWLNRRDWEENQNGTDRESDTGDTKIGCCTILR